MICPKGLKVSAQLTTPKRRKPQICKGLRGAVMGVIQGSDNTNDMQADLKHAQGGVPGALTTKGVGAPSPLGLSL